MNKLYKDINRIKHILDAIEELESFTEGLSQEEFTNNAAIRLASVKVLEIIREAAKHISESIKDNFPEIPWERIVAFRNVLVHEYFQIDLEIVWRVVQDEIPGLKNNLQKIIINNE
ncbi:MAG: DUF86 domain-containing protein [Cytophagales bacterium]|nr:DUF86 domain-containing protein [Cytophagales bacterium]